jgi:hypothetical protein
MDRDYHTWARGAPSGPASRREGAAAAAHPTSMTAAAVGSCAGESSGGGGGVPRRCRRGREPRRRRGRDDPRGRRRWWGAGRRERRRALAAAAANYADGGWLEWLAWVGVTLEVTLDAWRHPSGRHTYKMRAQAPRWKIHENTTAPYARAPCNITMAPQGRAPCKRVKTWNLFKHGLFCVKLHEKGHFYRFLPGMLLPCQLTHVWTHTLASWHTRHHLSS